MILLVAMYILHISMAMVILNIALIQKAILNLYDSTLKALIKSINTDIPKDNFFLFLCEAEFRKNFKIFNNNNIMKEYDEITKYIT